MRYLIAGIANAYANATAPKAAANPAAAAPPATPTAVIRSEHAADPDMAEILGQFVLGLPGQVAELGDLFDRGDLWELKRALHRIKGSGGGYGFPTMTQLAGQAEQEIVTGATVGAVARQVGSLIEMIRSVEGYNSKMEVGNVSKSSDH